MTATTEEPKNRILRLLDEGNLTEARPLCVALCDQTNDSHAWRLLGVVAGREGKFPEAERCFRESIARDPTDTKALTNLARVLREQGRLAEAADIYRAVLTREDSVALRFTLADVLTDLGELAAAETEFRNGLAAAPDDVSARYTLGWVYQQQGRLKEARECFEQVLNRDPQHAWTMNNLGAMLQEQGDLPGATAYYEAALSLKPEETVFYRNLGNALAAQGEVGQARALYEKSLTLDPVQQEVSLALGTLLEREGRLAEARAHYEQLLQQCPTLADAHYNLGTVHLAEKRHDLAEACYREVVRLNPKHVGAWNNLGNTQVDLGLLDEATESFKQAIRLNPRHAGAHNNLGNVLGSLARYQEAIPCFEQALRIQPDSADIYNNLGEAFSNGGMLGEAVHCFRQGLHLSPNNAELHNNLGRALRSQGKLDEGIACLREAVRLKPDEPVRHSNLLFTLNYHPGHSPQAIFEEHRRWGESYAPRPGKQPVHANSREPERRLKIGYVTPDLRDHSVSYFIEPVLAQHDRDRYEIYCYVEIPQPKYDATTERLKKLCTGWVNTCGLSDRALAERMRSDGIDMLVDLAGHTGNNRLHAFSYRPAPVQLTYLGYCNTTGLPAIRYRLTDEWADPPGQEAFHTEQLVRLAGGFLCYRPPDDAPEVTPSPALAAGHVTFGSFNILEKTNRQVVALWAMILRALPEARLVLKNRSWASESKDRDTCERYYAWFAEHGIAPERIELISWLPDNRDHLRLYSRIDIGLDTFPYNGTTTTCEALWMGVPVLALEGERHAARVGVSLMTRVGLSELVARDADDYVARAVALARDHERLAQVRAGLRDRMRASTLCDAARFTSELEQTYRHLWENWCTNPTSGGEQDNSSGRKDLGKTAPDVPQMLTQPLIAPRENRPHSGVVGSTRIYNLHHLHNDNIGDRHCAPFAHFSSLADSHVELVDMSLTDPAMRTLAGEIVVLGGGGSLNPWCWHEVIRPLLARGNRLIAWGIGHHHDNVPAHRYLGAATDGWRDSLAYYARDYPLDNFVLRGIRDYGIPHEYVPCVSCMSSLFDRDYPVLHDIVIYEHGALEPIAIDGFPRMSNVGATSFESVLAFLASGHTVITNSFHGAYWAQLLGRRVLVYEPWCTKFFTFKFPLAMADRGNWRDQLVECRVYPQALADSRDCNRQFAHKVFEYTHSALGLHQPHARGMARSNRD